MASDNKLRPQSFVETINNLARTQQFYWFIGHVFCLIFFVFNVIGSFLSRSAKFYRLALISILATYIIVIKQIHFKGTGLKVINQLRNKSFRDKLIRDDNVQYFLFATVLYLSSFVIGPIPSALYSFAIFSLFHSLTYFKSNILDSLPIPISSQQSISTFINNFTTNLNQQALLIAASSEVFIISGFVFVPFQLFSIFRNPALVTTNLIVFLSVVIFLKLRYDSNQFTKAVVSSFDLKINQLLLNPLVPPSLGRFYNITLKETLQLYLGKIQLPSSPTKSE